MSRIIDLTLTLKSGMRGVAFEPARALEKDGWNATTLSLYSHCGTHIDAPIHFGVGRQTINQLDVSQFISPAWVVDVRPIEPHALIRVEHMSSIADKIEPGDSILICTGWSEYCDQDRYRNELPRISADLARWCVGKQVRMLGVEPPSVADVNHIEELTTVHKILFEGNVIIVEGLANLQSLTKSKVTLIALPLKIDGGDGAPARAIAIEDID
ncbi:MAG: cyclase family protein [Sedimentisphaerales bacterium]|nr:cyclase family protein [Sedimentisphaerales bacterium]